jgi:hypothetical protein
VRGAVVAAVTQARPMLGGFLEKAATIVVDGGALSVTFGPSDAGIQRLVMTEDNVRSVEAIAATTLGRPLKLRVSGSSETSAPSARSDGEESRQELTDRAKKDPTVARLLTNFGAQIVDVRPLRTSKDEGDALGQNEEGA